MGSLAEADPGRVGLCKPLDRNPLQAPFHVNQEHLQAGRGAPLHLPLHPAFCGELSVRQEEGVPAGDLQAFAPQEIEDHGNLPAGH